MQNLCEINSSEIMDRMKKILGVAQDKELAQIVGIKSSSISNWKKINSIPFETLFKFSQTYKVSIDWLSTGKEQPPTLATDEKMMLLAFNDLDERGKLQALSLVSGLKGGDAALHQSVNGDGNALAGRDLHIKSAG